MQDLLKRLFGNPAVSSDVRPPAQTPAQQELNSLLDTAATALEQGFHETALETYQRGLTLARTLDDPASIEHFLSGIGAVYVAQEKFDDARPLFDEALEIARQLNDRRALARTQNNLGSFFAKQEEWGAAQTYHQQALDAARGSGNAEIVALALENLAKDYLQQNNPSYAQHLLKEAVIVAQAGHQAHLASRVIGLLAEATLAMGDRNTAHNLFTQAVGLAQQNGQPEQQLRWLQALAALEMENRNYKLVIEYLQAAENIALRLGNQPPEFFMNSALDLTTAYQLTGKSTQAEEYATRALAQARSTGNAGHEARALTRLGMAAFTMNDLPRAKSFLSEALAYYDSEQLTALEEHTQILLNLGSIAMRERRMDEAAGYAQRTLDLAAEAENDERRAEALHLLGNLAAGKGDHAEALQHWQAALALIPVAKHAQIARLRCDIARQHQAVGDYKAALLEYEKAQLQLNHIDHVPTRGLVLSNAATLYTEMGDVDTAQAFYNESIEIAHNLGDRHAEALRLGNLGWFYTLIGRPQTAIGKLENAIAISRDLEDTLMIAVQTNNLAQTYLQLKDYETARTLHKQAIAAATAIDDKQWLAVFQSDLARTLVVLDRLDEAESLLQTALATVESLDALDNQVRIQARLAGLHQRKGRLDEAEALALEAETQARRMYYQRGIAAALVVRGDVAQARGDEQAAQQHLAEALRLYQILHAPEAQELADRVYPDGQQVG